MEINPGPLSSHVLSRQHEHRSTDVWATTDYTMLALTPRQHLRGWFPPHERVLDYVRRAGFYCIHRLGSIHFTMDMDLITALVERWRPETHTFHLVVGEATITLQDVAVLLGLRVDGPAVTGTAAYDWPDVVQLLLGKYDPKKLKGSSLKISWIRDNFQHLPEDADEETVQCYARAYILMIMGGVLFPDASGGDLQLLYLPLLADLDVAGNYSWGGATLAYLYRQLCRAAGRNKFEIGGSIILLQLWAWQRIPIVRPRCTSVPSSETDPKKKRKNDRMFAKTSRLAGSQLPPFGDQFQLGQDSLALRWLGCSYSYGDTPHSLAYYRDVLDRQRGDQFIWVPYEDDVLARLSHICLSGCNVWMTQAPLICFDIVEWHRPERVMRQFGHPQHVPGGCDNYPQLHSVDRRGKPQQDWATYHSKFIEIWNRRANLIVVSSINDLDLSRVEQAYMYWYKTITRLFISPHTRATVGQHQPLAPDLYMVGQHVSTQGNDVLNQMSVDPSFFWHQQDTSGASFSSGFPRSSAHPSSSMPHSYMPPQPPMSSPLPPRMPSSMPPPMVSTPSLTHMSPYSTFSEFRGASFTPPPPCSGFHGFAGSSLSMTPSFPGFGPSLFTSTNAPNVFISPTRPTSRGVVQERTGFDPSLSCVREPSGNDEEEEEEDEDEDEDEEEEDEE